MTDIQLPRRSGFRLVCEIPEGYEGCRLAAWEHGILLLKENMPPLFVNRDGTIESLVTQ